MLCTCYAHVMPLKLTSKLSLLLQSKLAESEDKVAAMAVQLEQLHADRLRLENRNSVLEKVTLSAVCLLFAPYISVPVFVLALVSALLKLHVYAHCDLYLGPTALYRYWR